MKHTYPLSRGRIVKIMRHLIELMSHAMTFLIGERGKAKNAKAPYSMSLTDAKKFVACFVKEEYTPEEYETFLDWLVGATFEELNAVADEHEALYEHWTFSPAAPSPEWIARLEQKLDEADCLDLVRTVSRGTVFSSSDDEICV